MTSTMPSPRRDRRAGVYIHVPFCARLCPYCDFAVTVRVDIPHRAYADALLAEFDARAAELEGREIATIYLGGGTPSLWDAGEMARVLDAVRARFDRSPGQVVETTLEANPNQITAANLEAWRRAGIDRLSIGCQSFEPRVLRALRRNHSGERALESVALALEHMPRVSLDLLFGNPDQTHEEWERDLARLEGLVARGLGHVSAYHLTIEPNTAFWIHRNRGTLNVADDEGSARMMERLVEACAALGLERYEVSSFGRPDDRSQHNTTYWLGGEYLGLGTGAHSFAHDPARGPVRRSNPRKLDAYLADPCRADETELLTAEQHLLERLFLGVRTQVGLDVAEIEHQFAAAIEPAVLARARAVLASLEAQGMVWRRGTLYGPTARGFMFADSVAERFYDAI